MAVVERDVARLDFLEVFEEPRAVAVLRIDEQIVLVRQWAAGHGIDRVRPGDDRRIRVATLEPGRVDAEITSDS